MGMLTTFISDDILVAYFDGGAPSDPVTAFAALLETVTDHEAGTVLEASYTGYAREALSFGAPGAGLNGRQIASDTATTFGQKTDAPVDTMIALGIYTLITGGNLMAIIMLDGGDPVPFTGANTGDLFTAPAHAFVNDDRCRIVAVAGGSLPTGVSEDTTYWIVGVSGITFQLSLTQGGGAVVLTADGDGIAQPLLPKDIELNDIPEFAIGNIVVSID